MVVPSPPTSPDKLSLRRRVRQHRKSIVESLDKEEKSRLEFLLADRLMPLIATSRIVGGYSPMAMEISPLPALEAARAAGRTVAYPGFADKNEPFRFLAGDPTEPGPWSVAQPSLEAQHVFPDLILLPLVAVDRKGTRLGQGKGHYDRVAGELRRHGALLIGVGWDEQRVDEFIPTDPWDVPLDGFASPSRLEMYR